MAAYLGDDINELFKSFNNFNIDVEWRYQQSLYTSSKGTKRKGKRITVENCKPGKTLNTDQIRSSFKTAKYPPVYLYNPAPGKQVYEPVFMKKEKGIWSQYRFDKKFLETEELFRLGLFFHLDLFSILFLILKNNWESYIFSLKDTSVLRNINIGDKKLESEPLKALLDTTNEQVARFAEKKKEAFLDTQQANELPVIQEIIKKHTHYYDNTSIDYQGIGPLLQNLVDKLEQHIFLTSILDIKNEKITGSNKYKSIIPSPMADDPGLLSTTSQPDRRPWKQWFLISVLFNVLLLSYTVFKSIDPNPPPPFIEACITTPADGDTLSDFFDCSGYISDHKPGLHYWIMVEIWGPVAKQELLWPKTGELELKEGKWSMKVKQSDDIRTINLSLWVVNKEGNEEIKQWMARGIKNGNRFPAIKITNNMRRIDYVSNLNIKLEN
jgi:hypothetical protein